MQPIYIPLRSFLDMSAKIFHHGIGMLMPQAEHRAASGPRALSHVSSRATTTASHRPMMRKHRHHASAGPSFFHTLSRPADISASPPLSCAMPRLLIRDAALAQPYRHDARGSSQHRHGHNISARTITAYRGSKMPPRRYRPAPQSRRGNAMPHQRPREGVGRYRFIS